MTHPHTPKSERNILGNVLSECSCGARVWSHGRAIVGAALDSQGWYVPDEPVETKEEAARRQAIEKLQTEGYGYDWDKRDAHDPLDSHHPDFQD